MYNDSQLINLTFHLNVIQIVIKKKNNTNFIMMIIVLVLLCL